jgi:hypothetical protein
MEKRKWLLPIFSVTLSFFLFFSGIGFCFIQKATAEISPNDFNHDPIQGLRDPSNYEPQIKYGWCTAEFEVLYNDLVYYCPFGIAISIPPMIDRVTMSLDPYSTGITAEAISTPSDYVRRVCYIQAFGSTIQGVNYGNSGNNIDNKIITAGIVLDRIDNYSFPPLPNLPNNQKWNTCKVKESTNSVCVYDAKTIIGTIFQNKFPLDMFDINHDQSAVSSNNLCPQTTIMGQIFKLCFLKDITSTLKYVILIIFIINSINYL